MGEVIGPTTGEQCDTVSCYKADARRVPRADREWKQARFEGKLMPVSEELPATPTDTTGSHPETSESELATPGVQDSDAEHLKPL
ncbi:hypothetical protein AAHC03_020840 [Spirometra sp. Aus1]